MSKKIFNILMILWAVYTLFITAMVMHIYKKDLTIDTNTSTETLWDKYWDNKDKWSSE